MQIKENDEGQRSVYVIPVVKAPGQTVEIDIGKMETVSYEHTIHEGLKHYVNAGATKIKQDGPDGKGYSPGAQADALKLAQEKATQLMLGTYKFGRQSAKDSGRDHKVVVLATQLARDFIKKLIKDNGGRVTHYKASEITAAAKEMLVDEQRGAWFFAEAEKAIAARDSHNVEGFELKIKPDAEKQAKAQKKGKVDLGQLSAAAAKRTSTSSAALKTAH